MVLLDKKDVRARLGVSERTIEIMLAEHRFPPPIRLGKRALWAPDVVEGWLEQQLEQQRRWRSPR